MLYDDALTDNSDPYDLARFIQMQETDYDTALKEIKDGMKISHWMWYIFPQFKGLGSSTTSIYFSIKSVDEAKAYLDHPILGARLIECIKAALGVEGKTASEIFGFPDDLKLKSCATLFDYITEKDSVFDQLLVKYYDGERDDKTLQLIEASTEQE